MTALQDLDEADKAQRSLRPPGAQPRHSSQTSTGNHNYRRSQENNIPNDSVNGPSRQRQLPVRQSSFQNGRPSVTYKLPSSASSSDNSVEPGALSNGTDQDTDDAYDYVHATNATSWSTRVHNATSDRSYPMRHGWDSHNTVEQMKQLASNFFIYYNDKRHERNKKALLPPDQLLTIDWRMRDRLKTLSAVLVLCLNIGVDPPDVLKSSPSARLECWIDPITCTSPNGGNNALARIGKALENQYSQLSIRTKYKQLPDPTIEDIKKETTRMRRYVKDERCLFHYNGHGVPKPTPSGEIWVFNKDFTQYIPITLYELQNWLGSPCLLVWDCSQAGMIIQNYNKAIQRRETTIEEQRRRDPNAPPRTFSDCIHLAACRPEESLPTTPLVPADLFTCCLTSPIEMAIRFFVMRNPLSSKLTPEEAANVPGKAQERRTPMGELTWIFTAITDTIAWNCLPRELFKKLFRQDLMVAALFRNFLLAQRVMRYFGCHPQSYPVIPETHAHRLWDSWDYAVELVLHQLPMIRESERLGIPYEYQHSAFFAQQLRAFELYLEDGASTKQEPEQLPIVLQVLLSQVHRLRALVLLSQFLDLGPWAVELALSIGIFPYVLKLLQSQAVELKPPLVFIWTRILAVDQTCQSDLLKDNGYQYFIGILQPNTGLPVRDVSEHRAMCAFILAMFCRRSRLTQEVALSTELMRLCLAHLSIRETEDHPLLRQWACLCLGSLWEDFPEAKWHAIKLRAHYRVCELALDPVPEVRASMLCTMTQFLGVPDVSGQSHELESFVLLKLLSMVDDGSNLVRKELTVFLSAFIIRYNDVFAALLRGGLESDVLLALQKFGSAKARRVMKKLDSHRSSSPNERIAKRPQRPQVGRAYTSPAMNSRQGSYDSRSNTQSWRGTPSDDTASQASDTSQPLGGSRNDTAMSHKIFQTAWKYVLYMTLDPDAQVARNAQQIVDYVHQKVLSMKWAQDTVRLQYHIRRTTLSSRSRKVRSMPATSNKPSPEKPSAKPSSARDIPSLSTYSSSMSINGTPPSRIMAINLDGAAMSSHEEMPQEQPHLVPVSFEELSNQTLSIESTLFDEQLVYFRESQMRPSDPDQAGSATFNERLVQSVRNEATLERTQRMKDEAGSSRWDKQYRVFDSKRQRPHRMCLHQFNDHLATAEWGGLVKIWDWDQRSLLNTFQNGNAPGTAVTQMKFINEDDKAMLVVGSDDGTIRIHAAYDDKANLWEAASFRASKDARSSAFTTYEEVLEGEQFSGATFVFDFVQARGHLFAVGNSREVQVWDVAREMTSHDISLGTSSPARALTTDQVTGNTIAVGFADGSIRVYDQRQPSFAVAGTFREHKAPIVNVHIQRGGQRELASGSADGRVKTWDIRQAKSINTVQVLPDEMRHFIVHEHAPVFAAASRAGNIRVHNITSGGFLSSFVPTTTRSRVALPAIGCMAFHPHKMVLCSAFLESGKISLFTCNEDKYHQEEVESIRRLYRNAYRSW